MNMRYWLVPILLYAAVCLIGMTAPASEGYDAVAWKLFVSQVVAIPVLLVASVLSFYVKKKQAIR
ncbi:DUF4017 family protein [Aneurinibacillus sp. REN35]|uniref:DUF4017 family protein n=1 Tax=Aneurinibacillus sp. REN35 TaxID=3237286 RepID=UPI00352758EA